MQEMENSDFIRQGHGLTKGSLDFRSSLLSLFIKKGARPIFLLFSNRDNSVSKEAWPFLNERIAPIRSERMGGAVTDGNTP